jgi:hypothetical protein
LEERDQSKIHSLARRAQILKYPNVIGYSNTLKPKIKAGRVIPEKQCIRVYVTKKVPKEQLKPSEVIPEEIEGICTDVVEVGKIRARQALDPRGRFRPAPAGVSTSRVDEVAAGTVGWYFIAEDGVLLVASNNHVWAKENAGKKGDLLTQPGLYDGGDPSKDALYTLYDFVPIDFSKNALNATDVAVALPNDYTMVYMNILNTGGITGKRVPSEGEKVKKFGRTTLLTEGVVIDVSATLQVEYDSGTATFTDIIVIQGTLTSQAGDSGSPVFTEQQEFVGLLFGGSEDGKTSVICKYTNIEAQLTQKLNKRVFTLVAPATPPFFRETAVQVVPKDTSKQKTLSLLRTIAVLATGDPRISLIDAILTALAPDK